MSRWLSVVAAAVLVGLAGLVPIGTVQADSTGPIQVLLDGRNEAGVPVFSAVGMGTGVLGEPRPGPGGSFFDVFFDYDASYLGSDGPHQLMVRGSGQALVQGPNEAQMQLLANIVVDGEQGPTNVPIGVLRGNISRNSAGQAEGPVDLRLANPVGPFTLPGLPPFIFPIGDHRITGTLQAPEPASILLLGASLVGLGTLAWRRRR